MNAPTLHLPLQLPDTRRGQSAFREQRRQKLKEHIIRRKTMFACKQENQIPSSRGQRVMTSEDQVQEGIKALKLETKLADKENIGRPTGNKNNSMEKNCTPLKPYNELTNSTTAIETHNFEDINQTQKLPIRDELQSQNMTLSQAFHRKNSNKNKQVTVAKPKQDANMHKKLVLGYYRGQIVESKVNSFRKPLQVKDESFATTKKLSTTVSKVTEPGPVNTSSVTVRSNRAANMTAITRSVSSKSTSTTSEKKQLVRPSIKSHHNNTQDIMKQGISRTTANVTIRKGPHEKELLQSETVLSIKTNSFQKIKRNKALPDTIASKIKARPFSSSNTKLTEKSKTTDQHRRTIAKATVDRSAQPKETAEERKARLNEWRAGKGKVLKRPPNSVVTQPKPVTQNEKPVRSFWTAMAEEDEQRLFTEKVNKTFSECLDLINKGCPKEEILVTLNDLIKNIPDAKKLVKYWICLARIEPILSPIENILSIYEKAILAGAQPIEEMKDTIEDILRIKSQEKVDFDEHIEEAHTTNKKIQEGKIEDTGVDTEPEKLEMENEHHRNVIFQDCEKEHNNKTNKTKYPTDVRTDTETGAGCLIKYNITTTPYLQSIKKKMQLDETNSIFKELKFLTPVRRSRRLEEKAYKLPDILKDHSPCVSSLEQLAELGGETGTFVCVSNSALYPML